MRALQQLTGALVALVMLSACSQTGSPLAPSLGQQRGSADVGARSVAGRLLVKWKDAASANALRAKFGIAESDAVDADGAEAIQLPAGMSAEAFKRAAGEAVAYAEPDWIMRAVTPKSVDPLVKGQWSLKKVQAFEAWAIERGRANVKIAIIDTGVDVAHPDLRGQIAETYNALGGLRKLGGVRDENGHGTHCAGIAAAKADNQEGITGMAPGCKLMIVKALGADGSGAVSDIARGVNWAVDHGASVLSMSVGAPEDSPALKNAVARALAKGVIVVAAMGNEGQVLKNYPAAYPGVIAVGSTTSEDRVSNFSTRGGWISVSAPGSAILSTTPTYKVFLNRADAGALEPNYGKLSGTSMATPLVAGLAALVKSQHPTWTPAQVKKTLERTSDVLNGGFNERSGNGRVNALAALKSK